MASTYLNTNNKYSLHEANPCSAPKQRSVNRHILYKVSWKRALKISAWQGGLEKDKLICTRKYLEKSIGKRAPWRCPFQNLFYIFFKIPNSFLEVSHFCNSFMLFLNFPDFSRWARWLDTLEKKTEVLSVCVCDPVQSYKIWKVPVCLKWCTLKPVSEFLDSIFLNTIF